MCSVFALVMVVATAYDVIVVQWFGSMVKHSGSGQEVVYRNVITNTCPCNIEI